MVRSSCRVLLVGLVCAGGVLGVAAAATRSERLTPVQIELLVRVARAHELEALKALDRGDTAAAETELDDALSKLERALSSAEQTPSLRSGVGSVVSNLKQAILGDDAAISLLPHKAERGHVRAKINIAIVRKDQAIEALVPRTALPPPPPQPPPPPPPPAPPPPPPPAAPDGLLAGLKSLDESLDAQIARPNSPLIGFAPLSDYQSLYELGKNYLPLVATLGDADFQLMLVRDSVRIFLDSGYDSASLDAAATAFDRVANAFAEEPSIAGQWRTLANQTLASARSHRATRTTVSALIAEKDRLIKGLPDQYGAPMSALVAAYTTISYQLWLADDADTLNEFVVDLKRARVAKQIMEKLLTSAPPPTEATITEDDTWTHNPPIGKSNICVNVRTTPPQATISATLDGPNGYHAHLDKTPLDKDGTIQITAPITQAGVYTKTLDVYDASGNQTGAATATFTVAPPPQNGPPPSFGKPCPAPTS